MRRGMLLAWIVLVGCGSDSLGGLGPVPTSAPSATAPPPTASASASAPPIVDRDANPDNVIEASNVVEKQEAAAEDDAQPPAEASSAEDAGAPATDADSNPLAGWKVPLASCMNGQKQGCQGAPADEFCDSTGQCHTIDGGTGCQFQGAGPVFPQCAPGVLPCATATAQTQGIVCCFFSAC